MEDTLAKAFRERSLPAREAPNNITVLKADTSLGLVFGWAIVCNKDGEDYYDLHGDHIPQDSMLKSATDFMLTDRKAKIEHAGKTAGQVVFSMPITEDVAESFGLQTNTFGLMVAVKFSKAVVKKFADGTYTGFSIGGWRLADEENVT